MRFAVAAALLVGCGRIDFDPLGDASVACTFGPWSTPEPAGTLPSLNYSPTVTADGLEMFGNDDNAAMWTSTRASRAATFDTLANVPSPPAHNGGGDHDPSISDDGLTLYFTFDTQIFVTQRADRASAFGPASVVLSAPSTSSSSDVSSDQRTIYLDDLQDLYGATRTSVDDNFGAVQLIAAPVSLTTSIELYPTISTDERELYFQSDRNGRPHLWVATRVDRTAQFTTVSELPFPDAQYNDPDISSDGLELYMSTNLPGAFSIYVSRRACL